MTTCIHPDILTRRTRIGHPTVTEPELVATPVYAARWGAVKAALAEHGFTEGWLSPCVVAGGKVDTDSGRFTVRCAGTPKRATLAKVRALRVEGFDLRLYRHAGDWWVSVLPLFDGVPA